MLLSALFNASLGAVSAAPVGAASVTGTVLAADASGDPIADATVTLYAATLPGGRTSTQTDGVGAFRFIDVAAGRYRIGVSKQGFVSIQEGQGHYRSAGRPFMLRDGEPREVHLRLPRLGVITGRILDERGNPLIGASVRAWTFSMAYGYRRILTKAGASTDDRGMYRLHSLWPDNYLVCASTRRTAPLDEAQRLQLQVDRARQSAGLTTAADAAAALERVATLESHLPARIDPIRGYAPSCYLDTGGARASIAIGPGDERAGVDLRLVDTRLARIEGKFEGLALGSEQAMVSLLNEDEALGDVPGGMSVPADGRFRFWQVPPGRYAVVLRQASSAPGPSTMRLLTAAPVTVSNEDVQGLVLDVPKGATVRGQLVLAAQPDLASAVLSRAEVRLEPARHDALTRFAGLNTVRPDVTGRFEFRAIAPGSYYLSALLPEQPSTWFLDTVTLDGKDLLVDTIDLKSGQTVTDVIATFTQHRGSLAGTLLDSTGDPVPGAGVLVYPVDERNRIPNARRLRFAASSPDGDYVAVGLRPGEYRVVTLVDAELGAWFEPTFLQQLDSKAVQVSIAANENKILNLRVPRVQE